METNEQYRARKRREMKARVDRDTDYHKKRYYKNREANVAKVKRYADKNPEKIKNNWRRFYERSSKRLSEKRKSQHAANPQKYRDSVKLSSQRNREAFLARKRRWREANPRKAVEYSVKRRASTALAAPAWADWEAIDVAYDLARKNGLTVDHIVPLKSKTVCGLHVPDNMTLMTKKQNSEKFNRFWPDMP